MLHVNIESVHDARRRNEPVLDRGGTKDAETGVKGTGVAFAVEADATRFLLESLKECVAPVYAHRISSAFDAFEWETERALAGAMCEASPETAFEVSKALRASMCAAREKWFGENSSEEVLLSEEVTAKIKHAAEKARRAKLMRLAEELAAAIEEDSLFEAEREEDRSEAG